MDIRELERQNFADCLNTTFHIRVPGHDPVPIELTDVVERNDSPKLDSFSLIFHNAAGVLVPQGLLELEHEKLGSVTLFLVPLGPRDGRGMDYQAVFNRFRREGGSAA